MIHLGAYFALLQEKTNAKSIFPINGGDFLTCLQ